jgi:hypothetical protein
VTDDERLPVVTFDRLSEELPGVFVLIYVSVSPVAAGEHHGVVLVGVGRRYRLRVLESLVVRVDILHPLGGLLAHGFGVDGPVVHHGFVSARRRHVHVGVSVRERLQRGYALFSPVTFLAYDEKYRCLRLRLLRDVQ